MLIRHALAEYLRNCGYHVLEAATADEVRKVLGDGQPVEAVLCDTELDGFALRRWVSEHRPEVEMLLAGSVPAAAADAAELCEQGPDLARPYDPQHIVEHILRLRAARDRQVRD